MNEKEFIKEFSERIESRKIKTSDPKSVHFRTGDYRIGLQHALNIACDIINNHKKQS